MANTLQKNTFGDAASLATVDAALQYASRGWEVFPCKAGAKTPAIKWKADGLVTTDPQQVRSLFSNYRNANIAIIVPVGLLVLDVDTKDGKVGAESLAKLEAEYGKLPSAPKQRTWSGGYHLLFKLPDGVEVGISAGKVAEDLDVRANGDGYILCEPSVINGQKYQWEFSSPLADGDMDIPLAPDWLIKLASKDVKVAPLRIISSKQVKKADVDEELEFERIKSALFSIPAELSDNRHVWVTLGMALKNENEANYDLWCDWGSQSEKFNEADSAYTWKSFNKVENSITKATLFKMAREHGWVDTSFIHGIEEQTNLLTDLGNTKRLVALHGDSIRYCKEKRCWLCWSESEKHWVWDSDKLMRLAAEVSAVIFDEAKAAGAEGKSELAIALTKHAMKTQSLRSLKAMMELASYQEGMAINLNELDSNSWLLAVDNGVLNLKMGGLEPSDKSNYITKHTKVTFEATATCPTWEKFLKTAMGGNEALIAYLQRAIGYTLTASTSEQVMFLCHGYGANGKSVLLNILSKLVGDYAVTAQSESLMAKREGSSINNDIARLRGARLVTTSETDDGKRFAEAQIKQLTGGDIISARYLYAEFFEFIPVFKIWMAMNHRPIIQGDDLGIWRRIVLIPFSVTIPEKERDGSLQQKLTGELSGILNWAVAGCLEWQRIGLAPPVEILAATEGYKSDMDMLGNWLEDCCLVSLSNQCVAAALYASYREWCVMNGRFAVSNTRFGQKLQERGFTKRRSNGYVYEGLKLLT